MSLSISNTGVAEVSWSFPTGQRFDVVVYDAACREVWRWSRGRAFTQTVGTVAIAPGAILTYRVQWDERDQESRQIRPGDYEVRVVFLGRRTPQGGPPILPPLILSVR